MSKLFKKYFWVLLAGLGMWPVLLYAGDDFTTGGSGAGISNPIHAANFATLLTDILNILIEIGTPILVISLVWVGFMFIKARGSDKELSEAKEALKLTLIGAAVVIGAKAIAMIISNTISKL